MIAFSGFFCIFATHIIGKMLEWLKRHAWKACSRLKRLTGSNPVLSAKAETCIQAELVRAKVQVSAFASPRRRRSGMCERSEQIPRKERDVRAGGAGCANIVSKSHRKNGRCGQEERDVLSVSTCQKQKPRGLRRLIYNDNINQ